MAKITPFRAALPDLNDIISFDDFFGAAKRKFPLYLSDGFYEQVDKDVLYVYRITRPHRSHTGLLACASVLDYINGKIKKHENTLAAKEEKMMERFKERHAMIKPILLTYRNVLEIDALINRITTSTPPTITIPYFDEQHLFWQIEEEIIQNELIEAFDKYIPESYICDGHHRSKTAEILYNRYKDSEKRLADSYSSMFVAYFAASEIEIHNYNRSIINLKGLTTKEFLAKLDKIYEKEEVSYPFNPITKHHLGMYIDEQWYKLRLRDEYWPTEETPTNEALDVHILNKYVLRDILNIKDIRNEPDIRYTQGPKGTNKLEKKVDKGKTIVAFNLYPVAMENLIEISDQKETLPPKSTWIEPRMRNGMVAQIYETK